MGVLTFEPGQACLYCQVGFLDLLVDHITEKERIEERMWVRRGCRGETKLSCSRGDGDLTWEGRHSSKVWDPLKLHPWAVGATL